MFCVIVLFETHSYTYQKKIKFILQQPPPACRTRYSKQKKKIIIIIKKPNPIQRSSEMGHNNLYQLINKKLFVRLETKTDDSFRLFSLEHCEAHLMPISGVTSFKKIKKTKFQRKKFSLFESIYRYSNPQTEVKDILILMIVFIDLLVVD